MIINLLIYFILSFISLFIFAKFSYKFKFYDIPNKRSMHSKPTSYIGGLAISFIYVCSLPLFNVVDNNINLILSTSFLMAIIGFVDDRYKLNTGGKLSLQVIPIFYLIVIENFSLNHIGDYNYFKLELNVFAIPFTLLCMLLLINAFNYFDGIDGLLTSSSISVLLILYFLSPSEEIRLFLMLIIVPLGIFLLFNFSIANLPKLFLGDSGSLLLGFIIGFTLIYFANQSLTHPILLAWSISIFVYEFLSINILRLKNNKGIFVAGQDHLHHVLFRKFKSVFFINFLLSISNILFFIIGYFSFKFAGSLTSFFLFIITFIIFFIIRSKYLTN